MYGWTPYVPVAERRAKAAKEMHKLAKKGQTVYPVKIEGRSIAKTFWGKAWCDNLERYSDYANRLPRGRTYVRNGSVVDLQIRPGRIEAWVSGSELYRVEIEIKPLAKAQWKALCADCAGAIDSLVELLQGRLSKGVMERICAKGTGLFPSPSEIKLDCSCPDWADMCKHVAAVLYGIGARLDAQPELLFTLRYVDEKELLAQAAKDLPFASHKPGEAALEGEDLADLFGLDMVEPSPEAPKAKARATKAAPKNPSSKTPKTKPELPAPKVSAAKTVKRKTSKSQANPAKALKSKPTKGAKAPAPSKETPAKARSLAKSVAAAKPSAKGAGQSETKPATKTRPVTKRKPKPNPSRASRKGIIG